MITPTRAWNWFKNNHLWKLRRVPKVLQVEVTNKCNSNCEVCPRKGLGMIPKTMTLDEFDDILSSLKRYKGQISEFHPYRFGEPTMNKDLIQMCVGAKIELGCDTVLYTNGSGLTEDKIDSLFRIPIKKLVFSVEGFGKKQYEKLRKGMSWKHLCDIIKYASRGIWNKRPEIIIRYTKYPQSLTIEKGKEYGVSYLENQIEMIAGRMAIGHAYRKKFPFVDHVIGREYVDNKVQAIPELPCRILKTHLVLDAHRNLLMCCCGIKDNELGTWREFENGTFDMTGYHDFYKLKDYDNNLIKYWRDKRKRLLKINKIDKMPTCCQYCGVDVIKADDRWY